MCDRKALTVMKGSENLELDFDTSRHGVIHRLDGSRTGGETARRKARNWRLGASGMRL